MAENQFSVAGRLEEAAASGDRGATATEYAILIALIAIAIVGGITLFGTNLDQWFSTMTASLP